MMPTLAAPYCSDASVGIINIRLKGDATGVQATGLYSRTVEGNS